MVEDRIPMALAFRQTFSVLTEMPLNRLEIMSCLAGETGSVSVLHNSSLPELCSGVTYI